VLSTRCPGNRTSFKHQTKTAINNEFIKQTTQRLVIEQFSKWGLEHKAEMTAIINEVLLNIQIREKTDAIKKKVIKELSASVDTISGRLDVDKLLDCKSRDTTINEIYIVEGDSAKQSCKDARFGEFQAVMPIRGKILNCKKAELVTAIANQIIRDVVKVLGCGIEAQSKHIKDLPKFDLSKLRYSKIIICTDADIDGMHIRTLVLTMLYVLMPSVIKANKVWIAETPLYTNEVSEGRKKDSVRYYAYSEEEQTKLLADLDAQGIKRSKIEIARSKGLGENPADMMRESTMDPENRRLIPIEYKEEDAVAVAETFETLMGKDIDSRKAVIMQYFDAKKLQEYE